MIEKHDRNLSDVGVFHAGDIGAGPVALIHLPLRLRGAVHGCWVPAARLRRQRKFNARWRSRARASRAGCG